MRDLQIPMQKPNFGIATFNLIGESIFGMITKLLGPGQGSACCGVSEPPEELKSPTAAFIGDRVGRLKVWFSHFLQHFDIVLRL